MSTLPVKLPLKWIAIAPFVFVVLWSSGFIGAKYGLPYAEPFTFLFLRMFFALFPLGLFLYLLKPKWPTHFGQYVRLTISGLLMHAVYPGGVFVALKSGLAAGLVAVIVGLQPILTTLLAIFFLAEKPHWQHWVGLLLGITGIFLVVGGQGTAGNFSWDSLLVSWDTAGIGAALIALAGISLGTIYQKKIRCDAHVVAISFTQHVGAAIAFGVLALGTESLSIEWSYAFILALLWLVFIMSVGAIGLLLLMIRLGAASKVASVFFLVPPVTALEAYLFLGEKLSGLSLVGMGLTAVAVVLASGLLTPPTRKGLPA